MSNGMASVKLVELEEKIRQGEVLKIQSETKIQSLREQHVETQNEIKALGINPENAGEEYKKLAAEIDEEIKELERLIPIDVIEQYSK